MRLVGSFVRLGGVAKDHIRGEEHVKGRSEAGRVLRGVPIEAAYRDLHARSNVLLIEGDVAEEGDVDMAVRREQRDQREQAAQEQGDLTLDVEHQNPTHAEPSPLSV